jgi:uncharacterized protein YfaS (alpha-2-macroglobulin family)
MPGVRPCLVAWLALVGLVAAACRVAAPAGPPLSQAVRLPAFDPAALAEGRPPELGPLPPLRVRDYGPEGVRDEEKIRVRFDQAVVPAVDGSAVELELYALPQAHDGAGVADGPRRRVAARSHFPRPEVIELEPAEPLAPATMYEVVLPAGLRSRDGATLDALRWRFETPRPTFELLDAYDPLPVHEPFYLVADQPVRAEALAEHLRVQAPRAPGGEPVALAVRVRLVDRKAWPHAWRYEEPPVVLEDPSATLFAIEPVGRWPYGLEGTLRVEPGLRGEAGPLPLVEAMEAEIATRDTLRVLGWDCEGRRGRSCEMGPITIQLSTEVELEALARVRVRPRPAGLSIREDWEHDGPSFAIDGDFEPGRRYTVELPASLTDVDEQRLGRAVRVRVRMHELRPGGVPEQPGPAALWLSSSRGTFLRPEDARVGILARHVQEVRARVVVLDDEARMALLRTKELAAAPWPAASTTHVELQRLATLGAEAQAQHTLDLARFAGQGDVVLVELEVEALTAGAELPEPLVPVRGLFQISGLGAVVDVGPARGMVRVTHAADGEPWAGVVVRSSTVDGVQALGSTDADGLLHTPGARAMGDDAWLWLDEAATDDHLAVPLDRFRWPAARDPIERADARGRAGEPEDEPPAGLQRGERALVAMEAGRGLYLPGDTVHLAGWASIATPYGELSTRRAEAGTPVMVELRHGGDVVTRRRVRLDRHGRFWASLPLPAEAPLGRYEGSARMLESSNSTWLTVADTRIPTFEVEASMRHGQRLMGQANRLQIDARQLSGEPAPVERLRWSMRCQATSFWTRRLSWPWTFSAEIDAPPLTREADVEVEPVAPHVEVELATTGLAPRVTHQCSVSAAAQDVSLQEVGAETHFMVHPAAVYLGVLPPESAVAGQPTEVQVQAVDLQGRRVALAEVELRIVREPEADDRWRERGEPEPLPEEVARCRIDLPAEGEISRCAVRRPVAGIHGVRATATVDGIAIQTDARFEISPPPAVEKPSRASSDDDDDDDDDEAEPAATSKAAPPRELRILGPEQLPAGRPARIHIEAPWDRGTGVLTISQTGLRDAEPFVLRDGRATVTVTPAAGQGPRLELSASVARPAEDHSPPRVHEASHAVEISEARGLEVSIAAPATGSPGARVPVRITVRDAAGPVDARLAVWVVDDGVHQLRSPYQANLEWIFNPHRPRFLERSRSYDALLAPFSPWSQRRSLRVPQVRQAAASIKGAGSVEVYERFEAEPLFVGNVGTGPDGEVELPLSLPHDLTRFRISAVASAELPAAVGRASGPARFGRDEATLKVSAPLMVRLALPRVLRPGDQAELAALVTTPAGREGTLEVELTLEDADGRLVMQGPTHVSQAVDGRGPVRVPFSVRAEGPGQPAVRVHARLQPRKGHVLSTATRRPLTVTLERTAIERAAIHGRLDRDEPVAIPVHVPDGARPDHGGLTLSVRGSAVGDLDEAARYLEEYRYECLEQTASRLLPQVALQGLAERLPADLADPRARMAEGLARLVAMQRDDGTFTYWPDGDEVATHAGAYATWVMQLAADAGQPVPARALDRALDAMVVGLQAPLPTAAWERDERRADLALAAHVLVRAGRGSHDAVGPVLADLFEHRDALPLFARAWLLMALHGADPHDPRVATLQRAISASIEDLPGSAHPVEAASDRYAMLLDSGTRTHALVLLAWLQLDPQDPLVDRLAHGLRLRRIGGRWRNTQENAYALLALAGYAREREAVVPDQRIDAWIGPQRVEALELRGHDDAPRERSVSMAELLGPLGSDRTTTVVLDREGVGAAHYRLGMEWVTSGAAPARSQGLSLTRQLRDAKGELAAGAPLQAGRRYRIDVVIETDAPQQYLAVEVPLPAGLEAIDTRLGAGGAARALPLGYYGFWVSHEELHRDRVLLFADELAPGRHVHTVHVLATTPGRYVLPAAVVEAMYSPEVRARTTATRVRVSPSREPARAREPEAGAPP